MRALRHLPNAISLLRIALVVPAIGFLLDQAYAQALIIVAIAGVSDALDGYLAKHYGWHSALGAILDPLADKVLLVASYIALAYMELLPLWLTVLVLARDLIIVGGTIAYYVLIGRVAMSPSWSSKINTVLQIALVLWVITTQLAQWDAAWITPLVWLVAATSAWSGASYVLVWGRNAMRAVGTHGQ